MILRQFPATLILELTCLFGLVSALPLFGATSEEPSNLLALGEGTLPVVEPPSFGGRWQTVALLDSSPSTGWCSQKNQTTNNVFVFEMAAPATLTAFEFDNAGVEGPGRGAKHVAVEISSTLNGGFRKVLDATLKEFTDRQHFPVPAPVAGRFVRLTVLNNYGHPEWTELMSFRGYGLRPAPPASVMDISGTYRTSWHELHLRQQGTALTGCYEFRNGLFQGTIEGRVVKLIWTQTGNPPAGPAVFVFTEDGKSFRGYDWWGSDNGRPVDDIWNGDRISLQTGSCPHWSGSVSGELQKQLSTTGRARLYGILFDVDSARIRSESTPTLDEVVRLLRAEAGWKITIEGHTDSTGGAAHNQGLSEKRALAVRDYLVSQGIAAGRLASDGFGQSRPVADNATELGRAQNRRVDLVRQ